MTCPQGRTKLCPLHVLDLGLGVEEVERDLEADDLILERADRGADRLERLVDGRHIGHDDEQLADREATLEGVVGPVPQHERRADRGGHVHGEREQRLPHGQFHAGVVRPHALLAESAVLVALADERHDHPEHRQRLVDDREGLALQALDVQQPGLDVLDVVADRKVEQGDDRHRQQGQSRVDEQRDPEHPGQRQHALGQRRDGHDQPRGRTALVIDQVDQHAGPALIVIGHRQPLGMLEQVATKVEPHAEVELGVDVVLEHIQDIDHERHEQAAEDDQGQQDRAVARPGGERPARTGGPAGSPAHYPPRS